MGSLRVLSAMALIVTLSVTKLLAEDSTPAEGPRSSAPADPQLRAENPSQSSFEVFQPCLGRGYIPYSYPAFDSCPCAAGGCFHPAWYYCGGANYREQWFCRWLKVHLGHGSMLDGYPCDCIRPAAGRAYLRSVSASGGSSDAVVLPAANSVPKSPE